MSKLNTECILARHTTVALQISQWELVAHKSAILGETHSRHVITEELNCWMAKDVGSDSYLSNVMEKDIGSDCFSLEVK